MDSAPYREYSSHIPTGFSVVLDGKFLIVLIAVSIAIPLLPCRASSVQKSTELDFILSCNPIQSASKTTPSHTNPRTFPAFGVKTLLVGAIRFYQLFISTQDGPACTFVPSCSRFGAESIRRMGVARGILLTADRLQRCNGVSVSRYQTDPTTGYFMDPVQSYQEIFP